MPVRGTIVVLCQCSASLEEFEANRRARMDLIAKRRAEELNAKPKKISRRPR